MPKKSASGDKKWMHSPDALLRGGVVYNVKYLGNCEVEQPKGVDVVKEGIRKMKFTKHIKKAEGVKSPRIELVISATSVVLREEKRKLKLDEISLPLVSFCADDKTDKRVFTFIAKDKDDASIHRCHVFDSNKCAEEITLTIGQAFHLAYQRYLQSSDSSNVRQQLRALQARNRELEDENRELLQEVATLSQNSSNSRTDQAHKTPATPQQPKEDTPYWDGSQTQDRAASHSPEVGPRLQNLTFDDNFVSSPAAQTPSTANGNGARNPFDDDFVGTPSSNIPIGHMGDLSALTLTDFDPLSPGASLS